MHVNGNQVNYSRLPQSMLNLAQASDDATAEQTAANVISHKPVGIQDVANRLNYSLGGWQPGQTDHQKSYR